MQGLALRHATKSDYDGVVSLMRQLNPDDPIIDRTVGLEIFDAILEAAALTIFVADLDGRTIATCYLNVIPNLTRGGQAYAVIEIVGVQQYFQYRARLVR